MGLREFRDSKGVSWKVWDVTPESIHPVTAAEEFLAEYRDGWLCFESASERRRLARYPLRWDELSEGELRTLLSAAAIVPARKTTHLPPSAPPPEH